MTVEHNMSRSAVNGSTAANLMPTTDFYADYYEEELLELERQKIYAPYNIAITLCAFVGIVTNLVGIVSLAQQKKSQRDCSIRSRIILLMSLSMSDIATCTSLPLQLYVTYAMEQNDRYVYDLPVYHCVRAFLEGLVPTCSTLSLLNLLGMALDHWITFTKPFRYFSLMSRKRAMLMVAVFWTFALLMAFSEFIGALHLLLRSGDEHFCFLIEKVQQKYSVIFIMLVLAPFCLVAMVMIYCAIFREIKQLVVAPPHQQDFGQARRALHTTLFILASFLVCWLPLYILTSCFQINLLLSRHGIKLPFPYSIHAVCVQWSYALLLVNSILDPLIYMSNLRMKLKSICSALMCRMCRAPDTVNTGGEVRREDAQTTHTLVTVRCNGRSSHGLGTPLTEPLYNANSAGY